MPTYEDDVIIQHKQGNDAHIIYPVTKYDNVLDAPVVYNGFDEVDAAYSKATPLVTVVKAMQDNSVLHAVVDANNDYPATGTLEVHRYADRHADCQLRATSADGTPELWLASFSSEEIEQIFGGGALNKWSKTALDADLEKIKQEVEAAKKSVSDGKQR